MPICLRTDILVFNEEKLTKGKVLIIKFSSIEKGNLIPEMHLGVPSFFWEMVSEYISLVDQESCFHSET